MAVEEEALVGLLFAVQLAQTPRSKHRLVRTSAFLASSLAGVTTQRARYRHFTDCRRILIRSVVPIPRVYHCAFDISQRVNVRAHEQMA